MASGFPEGWNNYFLFSIQRRGSSAQSAIEFAAIVDPTTLELPQGERVVELMQNAAGGGIYGERPQALAEIRFDVVPVELDSTSGIGLFQQYFEIAGTSDPNDYDTSEPLDTGATDWSAGVDRTRDRFRLTFTWTNDTALTTAQGQNAASTEALRYFANNAIFTNMEPNMRDNQLKASCTFMVKPFDKGGTKRRFGWTSGDATQLAALTSYTTSNFPD